MFITIERYRPMDDNGYIVWAREMKGDRNNYDEVEEQVFGTKKEAMAWAKSKYPKVPIQYTTEINR